MGTPEDVACEEYFTPPEKTLPPNHCIRFWESMLFHDKAFLPPSTVTIIQATIHHLKENSNDR